MPDNVTFPLSGTGDSTAVCATELINGAQVQRLKLALGNLDVDDADVSDTNPIPALVRDFDQMISLQRRILFTLQIIANAMGANVTIDDIDIG